VRTRGRRSTLPPEKWLAAGLLLAVAALVVLFSTSTAFFVYSDETEYVGLQTLAQKEVWDASGLPEGLSVFFVNTATVEQRLETLPSAQEARVSLRFPNRLRIAITERKPAAVWSLGDRLWWVDEAGRVLCEASVSSDLPVVISVVDGTVEPGSQVDETAARSAATYSRLLEGAATFRYAPGLGLSLVTPQGWPVHLGDDTDCERKIIALLILTEYFAQQGIQPQYADLRVPEAPSYK
jgi:cell division septal protein FtsQ